MNLSQHQANLCAALADHHRVLLLYAMADEPRSVGELVTRVGLSQPAVSRHLRILRENGVVSTVRSGKLVYYSPADPRIMEALDLMRAILTEKLAKQGDAARSAAQRPTV